MYGRYQIAIDQTAVSDGRFTPSQQRRAAATAAGSGQGALVAIATWPASPPKKSFPENHRGRTKQPASDCSTVADYVTCLVLWLRLISASITPT